MYALAEFIDYWRSRLTCKLLGHQWHPCGRFAVCVRVACRGATKRLL